MTKPVRTLIAGTTVLVTTLFSWSSGAAAKEPTIASPASPASPTKTGAKVLSPSQFTGQAAVGYAAAQQISDLLPNLFCYCGCDLVHKHTSLLDCFTCDHSADCQPCVDEALLAARMKKDGKGIAEIQKAIDKKFEDGYPYEKPTLALERYRARASAMQANTTDATKHGGNEHAQNEFDKEPNVPKLKPGAKAGECCGGKKDH